MEFKHIPVLFRESIDALDIKPDGLYADCTAGGGGHSNAILDRLSGNGRLVAIDRDPEAIETLTKRFEGRENVSIVNDNFFNIKSILSQFTDEGADGILADLGVSSHQLDDAARFDEAVAEFAARARSQALELDALADDVSAYLSRLDADPERLAQIHARRAAIKDTLRGRAADIESLLVWATQAHARLEELCAPASDPEVVERELAAAQRLVLDVGARLTKARTRLARELAKGVNEEIHALAMPDATLHIDLESTKPTSHGCETVVFRLQPHPHAPARPLGQGASGGELSRVMLALELMLGRTEASSTFIFDEIDAGIGGQTATEVGARLKRLADSRQVIVVTHLAQVAAFGDQHLVIEKNDGTTNVREVTGTDREAELTRMMGGDPHSQAARRHASRVLASAVSQSQG